MTMDNVVVPQDVVPVEGTIPQVVEKPPEPSAEEKAVKLIEAKVAEALARATEMAKREIQSAKDKATAEVQAAQRRARVAESTLTTARNKIQELDPESAKELELQELREKVSGMDSAQREEQTQKLQGEFHNQFITSLQETITDMGVDPEDKRIDWAIDVPGISYLELNKRVIKSAAKIQREKTKEAQSSLEKRLKEVESKVDMEINSVETISGGVAGGGIPTNMEQFKKWIETISQAEYEKKYASKVKDMMREGKIK